MEENCYSGLLLHLFCLLLFAHVLSAALCLLSGFIRILFSAAAASSQFPPQGSSNFHLISYLKPLLFKTHVVVFLWLISSSFPSTSSPLFFFFFFFLPSCLSVSRRRGDSKSPRRKPIRLGESARQSGRGFLIWIYLRKLSQTKPHLFSPPCLVPPPPPHPQPHPPHPQPPPPPSAHTDSEIHFVSLCFFPLWFCFRRGLWKLWYTEIPVSSCFPNTSTLPLSSSSSWSHRNRKLPLLPSSLLHFGCPKPGPPGQIPDIKVSIEEPSVRYQLMWDTTN